MVSQPLISMAPTRYLTSKLNISNPSPFMRLKKA
ncbi:Uncharacterised protein [Vibrio cholerae]|nr:Uncharacterised protein [Vibrio cholerae]